MPTPRSDAIAGVCSGNIYVIGGTSSFINTDVVEKFNPQTGLWDMAPSLPAPGAEFAANGVSDGSIIMAVGSGLFGSNQDINFVFHCGAP